MPATNHFEKHRFKKFIKDVVYGTIERKEIIENFINNELKNDINDNKTELIIKLMLMEYRLRIWIRGNHLK